MSRGRARWEGGIAVAKEISQLRKKQKRREFLMAVPLILFTVLFIVGQIGRAHV